MNVQDLAVRKSFPLVKSSIASVFSKALIQISRLTYHLRVQKAGLDMLTPNSLPFYIFPTSFNTKTARTE